MNLCKPLGDPYLPTLFRPSHQGLLVYEIDLFIKLTFFEEFSEFGLIVAFVDISHTIFAVQSVTFGLLFLQCDITLSVLRIFVHSISCHFSCQKLCNSNFSVKSQHLLLYFCHLTQKFSSMVLITIFYDVKPNFLLEAGQILERSQLIQIL